MTTGMIISLSVAILYMLLVILVYSGSVQTLTNSPLITECSKKSKKKLKRTKKR